MKNITQEEIYEDVYIILKTIYHYEQIEVGRFGFGITELYVLEYVARNAKSRVTDLSRELNLPMFTISRMVNRMVTEGYLTKEQDNEDHRNFYLALSQKGTETRNNIKKASTERITTNLGSFSPDQVESISKLADNLHIVLGVSKEVLRQ